MHRPNGADKMHQQTVKNWPGERGEREAKGRGEEEEGGQGEETAPHSERGRLNATCSNDDAFAWPRTPSRK